MFELVVIPELLSMIAQHDDEGGLPEPELLEKREEFAQPFVDTTNPAVV